MLSVYNAPTILENVQLNMVFGAAVLSLGVMAVSTIFYDLSIRQAVALAQIPWMVQNIRSLFIERFPQRLGKSITGDVFPLVLEPWFMWSCWNNNSEATILFAVIQLINGIVAVVAPDLFTQAWGDTPASSSSSASSASSNDKKGSDKAEEGVILRSTQRTLGFALTSIGTFIVSMEVFNMDATKALGYSWIPIAAMLVNAPQMNDELNEKFGLNKVAIMAWIPIHLMAIAVLCFQN